MENQSPVQRIWELGKDEHGRLITAVVLAVLGVFGGMVPYFAAAKVIVLLLAGENVLAAYTPWLLSALGGYLIRTVLYIHGIEVIKAFNQGKKSYARFVDKVRANAQYYYDWMRRSQLGMSMAYAFFPAQMLTVLPLGWIFYLHGTLSAETFITVIILALGMSAPIVAAFNFVDTLAQVGTTVGQVDEILKAEEQSHSPEPVVFNGHSIDVKNVSFGYHDDKEILHGISLSIPQNSMTALVGPSGSGKSTLAKLIAGFWDVKDGSIAIDGHDLKNIPLTQLYDQVAFVSQDNYLFDESIRENIRMGRAGATDAEVETAARAAGCNDFISGLENGYDTVAGEGGASLSGGEKQRISIARAMLKDAPVIILDEATANVDPENEDRLQKAIEALTRDKTIIMIAHRLKTVRHADQILVIDHGKIVYSRANTKSLPPFPASTQISSAARENPPGGNFNT